MNHNGHGSSTAFFRASDSEASILFLPDELVERICLQAVDGERICRPSKLYELHHLSRTCRRIRSILLPRIYRDVVLENKPQFQFFRLIPMYGHLCRSVTLHISGSNPHNFTLFTLQCEYLTRLQVLRLHIQPNEGSSSDYFDLETMGMTDMNIAGLMAWKGLFLALPGVSELHLQGFTWTDAAQSFRASGPKPGITKLRLDIVDRAAIPILDTALTFNRIFPRLISISFATHWCLTPAWIRQAFASRRLQSIEVRKSDYDHDSKHRCNQESCRWTSSMEALVELSAASLTSLTISCDFSPMLSFNQSALPSLTTLTLMQGPDDPEAFNTLMEFFLHSPLQKLCISVTQPPESFCSWFHPSSGRWPALRTLSLQGILTQVGPGDDPWDQFPPEERDEWDRLSDGDECWSSHTRMMLEDYCTKRGIEFDFEWDWIEGFG